MRAFFLCAAVLAASAVAGAESLTGVWDASVVVNKITVPFRFELTGDGSTVKGSFFNGDERVSSTSGRWVDQTLQLQFAHYATTLEATYQGGTLTGQYGRATRLYPFTAVRHVAEARPASPVPSINGLWEIGVKSPKGEAAWRFIVRQTGPDVSAAILRVDGDTGTLTGMYRDGKFVLSHFSGARPLLLEVTPQADGTLTLVQNQEKQMTAVRPAEARAKGLPAPTDPLHHTSVRDPNEPFQFAFPDLNGKLVSNTDPRFRGKVVVVAVSGSWCPNCHDEAPFLEELYRKYRAQGLEIVALSFEEPDQLADPTRLRAFIRQYGLEYPVLVPGEPGELQAKLPQAVNLNAWPTTFYVGRDGRVRAVHAGFAGR